MFIRIIWNPKSYESPSPSAHSEDVLREEGGWWFSETILSSGTRSCFKVVSRHALDDGTSMIEVLSPLSDTFIATPCWQDGPPQSWARLANGWQLPSGLQLVHVSASQLSLVLQVPENIHNEAKNILQTILTDESQVPKDSNVPLKPVPQVSVPQEVSPLQMSQRPGPSDGTRYPHPSVPKGPYQGQVRLHELRGPASGFPKAVQFGSLCSPKLLPDGQLPRTKGCHLRERGGLPSQARKVSDVCLIDPQLS